MRANGYNGWVTVRVGWGGGEAKNALLMLCAALLQICGTVEVRSSIVHNPFYVQSRTPQQRLNIWCYVVDAQCSLPSQTDDLHQPTLPAWSIMVVLSPQNVLQNAPPDPILPIPLPFPLVP